MKRRDIVIGLIIVALVAALYFYRNRRNSEMTVPEGTIASDTTEKKLEEQFKTQIPDDAEKAELKDVSGGDGSAIASRKIENGKTAVAVLADLPDPDASMFYEVWVEKSETERVSLGAMRVAKGGWMLEQTSSADLKDHGKVIVTLETKKDTTPEKKILEGTF